MSNQQVTTLQNIEAALDQDVTLSSFSVALQHRVVGASIKYNMKYCIYKLEAGGQITVRAASPEVVIEEYNNYYNAVQDAKQRETK